MKMYSQTEKTFNCQIPVGERIIIDWNELRKEKIKER